MNLPFASARPAVVFETIPAPGPWIRDAACAGEPTDLFFPETSHEVEVAKAICASCIVRIECAGYAQDIPSLAGIWGGLTELERERLRRERYGPADIDERQRANRCRSVVSERGCRSVRMGESSLKSRRLSRS